ncbi:tripartite-type tricarboxylate transporter receptor subunit TctC [Paralcaligenes ureilyticus]|uniref:Tripartite-type tricarboxylate transporter receptor subunit TctC n=1 Tax=Paralcaligenes ureilyticus TaxID=627131 RepID=A0A4V2UZ80_9BURK|nr:tripartite-type tricarboxylate transporter receptor subunit TctC [Paralcaligenes ureilyticus]
MRIVQSAFHICLGLSALFASNIVSAADAYPSKAIKIIVSYPAGGANDIVARSVGAGLSKELGQSVIIDNITGAGGSIGAGSAARARPDGYTLFMGAGAHALAPSVRKNLPYDMVKSFEPISLAAIGTYVLVVNPSVKATSVAELVALARANPGKLDFASSGVGAPLYLAGVMFQEKTHTKLTHIPYRGDADANTAVVAGQVDMIFGSLGPLFPLIQSGKVRALAVTSNKRSKVVPNLPTLDEAGLKGYNIGTWWGLLAPAGTPKPIVDRLAAAVAKVIADPALKDRFEKMGIEAASDTPSQFQAFIADELARYASLTKAAGIEPQ